MDRFLGKVAVVTGASSGIGEAIAKELIKRGLIVVGLARRIEKMRVRRKLSDQLDSYKGKFYPKYCDLKNANQISEIFEWIRINIGTVSVLINCAGVYLLTSSLDVNEDVYDKTFDTNVKGAMLCATEVAKSMMNNDSGGHIVNISSFFGHWLVNFGDNQHALYSASKFAMKVMSEAMRREVREKFANLKITNLSPGITESELSQPFLSILGGNRMKVLTAEDVANACITVLDTPPHVLIAELMVVPLHQWV